MHRLGVERQQAPAGRHLLQAATLLGCCVPPEYVAQVLPLLHIEAGEVHDVAAAVQQVVGAVQRGAGVWHFTHTVVASTLWFYRTARNNTRGVNTVVV